MTFEHPIRAHALRVYHCPDLDMPYRVFFGSGREFPIYFDGASRTDAIAKAEAFRSDVIEKNEAAYINKMEAIAKARAAKARKRDAETA